MQDSSTQPAPPQKKPIRWGVIFAWTGLVLFLIFLGAWLLRAQKTSISKGETVPEFTLTAFDNQKYSLSSQKGKVIVLNFWASWCIPCEQEAAALEAAWQYYKPSGEVVFWGVDYVDTEPEAKAYLKKFNITYPNGADLGTRISQIFRIRGVPETYFIDPQGKLAYTQIGPFENDQQIQNIIDSLLKK